MAVSIYVEVGSKRVFACASDWPGWCRSAKDEQGAIEALVAYAPRYAAVAEEAKVRFSPGARVQIEVTQRITGGATTDFGAPEKTPKSDKRPLSPKQRATQVALMGAAWRVFDGVVKGAPESLTKGPRGGGRDREAVADHVVAAETAYARKLGVRFPAAGYRDAAAVDTLHSAIIDTISSTREVGPLVEKGWLVRYAIRRVTWHVLDHAWEIVDRSS